MIPTRLARVLGLASAVSVGLVAHGSGLAQSSAEASRPPEPAGYRQDAYQSPTPLTVLGTPALTTEATRTIWTEKRAVFIDVLPHVPKPAGLPQGTIWNETPHRSISGAVWLPEVGRGAISSPTDDYFRRNLERLGGGDKEQSFVVFCKRDCWMSWNAVKRARGYGFTHVSWYADGVEGWTEAGLPLAVVAPSP